jgi:hypothetical protein
MGMLTIEFESWTLLTSKWSQDQGRAYPYAQGKLA